MVWLKDDKNDDGGWTEGDENDKDIDESNVNVENEYFEMGIKVTDIPEYSDENDVDNEKSNLEHEYDENDSSSDEEDIDKYLIKSLNEFNQLNSMSP